ncbi:Divergent AAA domain protein [bacterium YEK0313]|nr:Divergent AAA domain protein [bacterium YEK0313]
MIAVSSIPDSQVRHLLTRGESHFFDLKSKKIAPAKLTRTLSAFANADGGELLIGVEEFEDGKFRWDGFSSQEEANGIIQCFEQFFPIGTYFRYNFLSNEKENGFTLLCEIEKTPDLKKGSDDKIYLRRGAQNLPQVTPEEIHRLNLNKGLISFEDQTISAEKDIITNSSAIIEFSLDIIPLSEPESWLRKQRLLNQEKPTVAGIVLFSDEPQTDLPKASVKLYRYRTSDMEGTRATLDFDPKAVEGNAYSQIFSAVSEIKRLIENIPVVGQSGLERIEYPTEAIHEIVTNAVIHRDYSLNDDTHVRIFDNRIEIQSPGILPAHINTKNILNERFARNPKIVRILNKFKNPPNKDVGEGLNTAFQAMRNLKLKDPEILQRDGSVLVILKHEKLGSPEQLIVEYLRTNEEINNATGRAICQIGSENTMKRHFQRMLSSELIERIPNRPQSKTGYRKGRNFPKDK